jgi:hypothetical protein
MLIFENVDFRQEITLMRDMGRFQLIFRWVPHQSKNARFGGEYENYPDRLFSAKTSRLNED